LPRVTSAAVVNAARCRHPLGTRETASHSPDCAPSLKRAIPIPESLCGIARAIGLTRRGFGDRGPRSSSRSRAAIAAPSRRRSERTSMRQTDKV